MKFNAKEKEFFVHLDCLPGEKEILGKFGKIIIFKKEFANKSEKFVYQEDDTRKGFENPLCYRTNFIPKRIRVLEMF